MTAVLFAYLGPETMLPLASVVATVVGVFLMFGRLALHYLLAPFKWILGKGKATTPAPALKGPTAWRKGATTAKREAAESEAIDAG